MQSEFDYICIGGGVVGLAVAYGLQKIGKSVCVVDKTNDFCASRGNFGLVWVQGKGIHYPDYAQLTIKSSKLWSGFATELYEQTNIDVALQQHGGYDFHFSEESLYKKVAEYQKLKQQISDDYPFEVLDASALAKEEKHIGKSVAGAILHQQDGHANPLLLLRALTKAFVNLGGIILPLTTVSEVNEKNNGYMVSVNSTQHNQTQLFTDKVILTAGLGAAKLAPSLGFKTQVKAQKGQLLITEKSPPLISRPSVYVRHVNEGGFQIGDSKDDNCYETGTVLETVSQIAKRAITVVPALEKLKIIRMWGALRVLTPDGFPIYQESPKHAGIYYLTCHSGITLAAFHALGIPKWLENGESSINIGAFSEKRFTV